MRKLITPHFILTVCFSTMVALMIIGLFFLQVPSDNLNIINMALGIVAGWVSSPVNYYFGLTENKNERINQRTD